MLCRQVVGEKLISPLLSDVDPIKMAKINEFYEKAVVKYPAPAGGHPVARSSAPAVSRPAPKAETPAAEKPKPKAKPVALIVNKPLSTKGVKSKTDCGRPKPSGGSATRGSNAKLASNDDLSEADPVEAPAPVVRKAVPLKGKSIIPPKSAAPKIASARSKTDCGLRKNASAPSLDKPVVAPSALPVRSKIGTGLKRPGVNGSASASNLPSSQAQPYSRSQSPLDEKRSDDYSDEEEAVIPHPTNRSRIMSATPLHSASKFRPQIFGSGYEHSPITTNGHVYYTSPRSATDAGINHMLADMNDAEHEVAVNAIQKLQQLLKSDQSGSLVTKVDQIIYSCTMKYRLCRPLVCCPPPPFQDL